MLMTLLSATLLFTPLTYSQNKSRAKNVNEVIAEARELVLKIMQNRNACAAWFQESDPNVAEIFQSLQYELDGNGESEVYRRREVLGGIRIKHPWGARAIEYAGKASIVTLNRNGPFFNHEARVRTINLIGVSGSNADWQVQMVGPFAGDTPEVRTLILLHELGHIIGRIPADDGTWNGDSARNTAEVLRHCKDEIRLIRQKESYARK